MYYVVEYKVNKIKMHKVYHEFIEDMHAIEISTKPLKEKNNDGSYNVVLWGGEPIEPGMTIKAYGEYATIQDARNAIFNIFGDVREFKPKYINENRIEIYKPGKYEPITKNEAIDILHHEFSVDVKAEMTDDDIEKLVDDYERALNHEHGLTMWHHSETVYPAIHDFTDYLKKHRDLLKLEDCENEKK